MNTLHSSHSFTDAHTQIIINTIKANLRNFEGSYIHHIHLTTALEENVDEDNLYPLQSFIRILINGKQTPANGMNNRDWFASLFFGGIYKITVTQKSPDTIPIINYHLWCFSKRIDLEKIITTDLLTRIKKNISNIELSSITTQPFSLEIMSVIEKDIERINSESGFDYFSVRSSYKSYLPWMFSLMQQKVKTFGIIYKRLHMPYLY